MGPEERIPYLIFGILKSTDRQARPPPPPLLTTKITTAVACAQGAHSARTLSEEKGRSMADSHPKYPPPPGASLSNSLSPTTQLRAPPSQVCVCDPGFAIANCSVECPGNATVRCAGHGACRDGHEGDGRCACDADYYGPDCSVECLPHRCFADVQHPPPRGACDPGTGQCVCQRNASGYWAGPHCNECAAGYWGLECNRLCACSGHGVCGWLDGECACYADAARGYWAGDRCDVCVRGYLEPLCRALNVVVSRGLELPAATAEVVDVESAVLSDEEYRCAPLAPTFARTGGGTPATTSTTPGTPTTGRR